MCGRYASARKRQELLEEFQVERDRVTESLPPDYNVAPTKPVYAVLARAEKPSAPEEDAPQDKAPAIEHPVRELRVVRWGLVPFWAKDVSIGSRLINARAETVSSKPAFRRAFARRRCLLPADGFYEWQAAGDGPGARKQPYFIHRQDGGMLAFAGLYELWRDKAVPDDAPDAWLWTATIITTRAQDEVGRIHDRMPMVIEAPRWADWLDPGQADDASLHALLAPASAGMLASYPVSTQVNSVRHNGPGLIEQVDLDTEPAGTPPPAARRRAPAGDRGDAPDGAASRLF
jgi:putative SOS response-associated peptidase YedK